MGETVSQEASSASKAAADIEALWSSYKKEQDIEQRNALIEHYLPLVRLVAGRLAIGLPSHVDRDDLLSSGFFGLLDAIERYDPTRRNKFETYAGVRIRGAMLDYLRAKDWMPVTMRQRIRKYSDVSAQLASELGREATDEEIRERVRELGLQVNPWCSVNSVQQHSFLSMIIWRAAGKRLQKTVARARNLKRRRSKRRWRRLLTGCPRRNASSSRFIIMMS